MSLYGSVIPSDAQGGHTFRNRFINGDFRVWQRGTSFSSIGTSTYSADRWVSNYGGTAPTFTRSTDVPTGFKYSISLAGSSTSFHGILQRIESLNTADLSGQTVTLSFYAKLSSGTATNGLSINIAYANSVDDFSSTTSVLETSITSTVSGSWTRYSYTFTVTSNMAANGFHVVVFNPSATQTFTMLLTGMQLERGSVATPFEFRPYATELQLCQRYFHSLGGDTAYQSINTCVYYSTTEAVGFFRHPVEMRGIPTISKSGNWTVLGGSGSVGQNVSADQVGPKTVQFGFYSGASGVSGQATTLRVNNDLNFRLTFSAEL